MPCIFTSLGGRAKPCTFQIWPRFRTGIKNVLNGPGTERGNPFVNVPTSDLDGEYLVVRANGVIGLRVEPQSSTVDDA